MKVGDPIPMLDLVYEAAVMPNLWPAVLDRMAQIAGGAGTFLITTDPNTIRWTSSSSLKQLGLDILEGHWHERNPRLERAVLNRHRGFVREIDMFTADEMDQEPTFRDLLRPKGFGWAAGAVIQVPSDDTLLFSVERRFADGPVENAAISELNALKPHLARAALMSSRLRLERANGMAEALAKMGLPTAVLAGNGKLISASSTFETLGAQIIFTAHGGIALENTNANTMLVEAIAQLNSTAFEHSAKSIAVPAYRQSKAWIIHLLPVRRSAHDLFGPGLGILVVTPLGSSKTFPGDLLNGLFDLSPAEVRAVNGLEPVLN